MRVVYNFRGKSYELKSGAEAAMLDEILSHKVENDKKYDEMEIVAYCNEMCIKDQNYTNVSQLAEWVSKNWEKVRRLTPKKALKQYYFFTE